MGRDGETHRARLKPALFVAARESRGPSIHTLPNIALKAQIHEAQWDRLMARRLDRQVDNLRTPNLDHGHEDRWSLYLQNVNRRGARSSRGKRRPGCTVHARDHARAPRVGRRGSGCRRGSRGRKRPARPLLLCRFLGSTHPGGCSDRIPAAWLAPRCIWRNEDSFQFIRA